MRSRRLGRVAALAASIAMGTTVAVHAASGEYVRQNGQIVFYYRVSAGDAPSLNWNGTGSGTRFCQDAPGATATQSFHGRYLRNRRLMTDVVLKERHSRYADDKYKSAAFSTDAGKKYHTDATWAYATVGHEASTGYARGKSC